MRIKLLIPRVYAARNSVNSPMHMVYNKVLEIFIKLQKIYENRKYGLKNNKVFQKKKQQKLFTPIASEKKANNHQNQINNLSN